MFGVLARLRIANPLVLIPIGVLAWYCMLGSGVHATIAGVLLGLAAPARSRPGQAVAVSQRLRHALEPAAYALAVPLFALSSAGVALGGGALAAAVRDPVAQGVAFGLVAGKPAGILAAAFVMVKWGHLVLDPSLKWADIAAAGSVAGIGFTVSLLISNLAFTSAPERLEHSTMGVLAGSLASALIGSGLIAWRGRAHRALKLLAAPGFSERSDG
jgi:NhaA family Na+:H+ antiporter